MIILCSLSFPSGKAQAQMPGAETGIADASAGNSADAARTDSVVYGFVPALAYSSDNGFIFGGLGSRYHYEIDIKPFRS